MATAQWNDTASQQPAPHDVGYVVAPRKKDRMRIGFIGMGKLGLPCALAMDMHGHDVMGYDIEASRMQKQTINYRETGPDGESPLEPILHKSSLRFGSLQEVVRHAEIIFVAIQTPHEERYEGITRIPDERVDFNYDHLVRGVAELSRVIGELNENRIVVIISTVLPGTIKSRILPVINKHVKLCYNPFFIAMGTTMRDFLNPEFVLFGVVDNAAAAKVEKFYKTLHNGLFYRTTLENAELIKVAYNTFIGMKIVYANVMMEICHKIGGSMDVDAVTNAMKLATDRLISPKYLGAGMGDGGGCHPRDNIAMSWLSRKLDLSYDFFDALMTAREKQTEWLAKLMLEYKDLPKVVLGKAFKPETNLTVGSPSILLKNLLEEMGHEAVMYDPYLDGPMPEWKPSVFLIGTKHPQFAQMAFPKGSVVIDPWRYIKKQSSVKIIPVGAPEKLHTTYPKISVVIQCFNREQYVAEAIESVLNQGYPNLECIVIDDDSTDGSWEVIERYKDRLAYCEKWPGKRTSPIHAFNRGFARSTGEIMYSLNDKNKLMPGSLFAVAKVFREFPDVEWLTGIGLLIDRDGIIANAIPVRKDFYEHLVGFPWAIQHESTFWRRSLWERCGGKFDEEYPWAFDAGLWRKFFFEAKLYHLNTVLGAYRKTPGAMSSARKEEFYGYYAKAREEMRARMSAADRVYMHLYKFLRLFKPLLRNIPDSIWARTPVLRRFAHEAIAFQNLNDSAAPQLKLYTRNPFRTIFPW